MICNFHGNLHTISNNCGKFNKHLLKVYFTLAFGLNIFISQIDTYIYNNYKHYK